MPQLIANIHEIMDREKRDMVFIRFGDMFEPSVGARKAAQQQLKWLSRQGVRAEATAPPGLYAGGANMYALHFTGIDDPRIADYSALYEDADGKSLQPAAYQMVIMKYEDFLGTRPTTEDPQST